MDWITGEEGQRAIADYQIDGEQPFHPNAEGQQ
jgi:ABC-type tungstate transport system permease subunit